MRQTARVAPLTKIAATPYRRALLIALVVNAALITSVAHVTLRRFPNSGDEYAYLLSASLFAQGRLSVPSPQPREFFDVSHVINDGRFFGKYPPGWPAVLAVFVRLGVPWLANLVIALATLVVIGTLARRHFGERAATYALLVTIACPFLVFNSASLFSHSLCLLCLSLSTLALLECLRRPSRRRWFVVLGAALGLSFSARPFTTVVIGALLATFAVLRRPPQWRAFLRNLVLFGAPALVAFLALFFLYDRVMTGSWFLQPFEAHDPLDKLGFHRSPRGWPERLDRNLVQRVGHLVAWMPAAPILACLAFLLRSDHQRTSREILLGSMLLLLLAAFVPYWGDGWFQYGPRYLYEAAFAVFILAGVSLARLRRLAPFLLVLLVALNVRKLREAHVFYRDQVATRMALEDLTARQGLRDALVFLGTGSGSMPSRDLTRNGIAFDGPVLYLNDRGPENAELLRRHPGRKGYLFTYDFSTRQGHLEPLESVVPRISNEAVIRYRRGYIAQPRFLD